MLHKSRGIVLHHIKYSESSVIAYLYTEAFGRQTYMINGIRSKKSRGRMILLHPLSLLNMEVYHRPKHNMQRIKEFQSAVSFASIIFDPQKSCISVFLAEVLYRVLREEEANPVLFDYLFNAIEFFDLTDTGSGIANFHLIFLLQLSRHLGFAPTNNHNEENKTFDLLNGRFVPIPPLHQEYLSIESSALFAILLRATADFVLPDDLRLSNANRRKLLDLITRYYNLHIEGMGRVKSLGVLTELFA